MQEQFAAYRPNPKDPSDWVADIFVEKGRDDVARLMAAAPDMLKALQLADDALCQATWERRQKDLTHASDVCRAAIAKATGSP